jgi:hypothetical protein
MAPKNNPVLIKRPPSLPTEEELKSAEKFIQEHMHMHLRPLLVMYARQEIHKARGR